MKEKNSKMAVIFDFGGVLLDWDREYLYRKMFNGDDAQMQYFLDNVCSLEWNARMDAGYPFSKAVEERIALFPDYEPYIRAYLERWEEMLGGKIDGTVDIMADLRKQGYPLAALSNWAYETFTRVVDRFAFLAWFDEIVLSGQVGVNKPDPAIYAFLLERIQREAHECLFIDDSEANITAARQLGFQTHLFTSPRQLRADLQARGLL